MKVPQTHLGRHSPFLEGAGKGERKRETEKEAAGGEGEGEWRDLHPKKKYRSSREYKAVGISLSGNTVGGAGLSLPLRILKESVSP